MRQLVELFLVVAILAMLAAIAFSVVGLRRLP